MSELIEERRAFVFPDGEEGELFVSREGPSLYRIQELLGLALYAGANLPEEAGIGWLLEVEEQCDGRLQVKSIREDTALDYLSGAVIPVGYSDSDEFRGLTHRITETGGNWELWAQGLFSAYVQRDASGRAVIDIEGELRASMSEWSDRVGPPRGNSAERSEGVVAASRRTSGIPVINVDADPKNVDWIKFVTGRRILTGVEDLAGLERAIVKCCGLG